MRRTHTLLGILCTLTSLSIVNAQDFKTALDKAATIPVEKVYIHYDKESYVAGETIWFKAYFYSNGRPSGLSTNFYLQFANGKGSLLNSSRFPVVGAVAKGSIHIPDTVTQGNYYVRAYTPAMLNGDEAMIYSKNIFVFHPTKKGSAAASKNATVSLQFFPESGHLVDGILNVVGFKANDQGGMPVDIDGVIRTEEGTTIASFRSYHDGIGKVQFKPQAGKKYVAEVETAAGKKSYPLPEVQPAGINLKVQDEKGGKKFQLSRSEKDKALFDNLTIVAEMNNQVVYQADIAFEDYPSIIGHIVTDSLPSGILHFTVFNKDGLPLAERLTFIDNKEYRSQADINMEKTGLEKRALNTVDLKFAAAIQRSCSISVTDLSGDSFNDVDNIWSRMLLTGDLKGYVHNPAWYFVNGDSSKSGLDNLMLTQGWSRYTWTKIMAGQFPSQTITDPPYISLSGKVTDPNSRAALSGGKLGVYLEAGDSSTQSFEIIPDASGRFRVDSMSFRGATELFYGYTDNKGKVRQALVVLDEDPLEKIRNTYTAAPGLPERNVTGNNAQIKSRFDYEMDMTGKVKELENIDVKSSSGKKPSDIVNEKYTTGTFKGESAVMLDNINEPAGDKGANVIDYVKNRIQQLEIQGGKFVNRKNISLMTGQKWIVGIFLNDQPVDMTRLRSVRMDQVALVKFFDVGFVGVGSSTPGGALAVYTKEKDVVETKPDKLESVSYPGYTISKEFYNPDYSVPQPRHQAVDRRTTLYWNADAMTDASSGNLKFSFYNNDFSKKYKIVVEGFDAEGKLVHAEKTVGQ